MSTPKHTYPTVKRTFNPPNKFMQLQRPTVEFPRDGVGEGWVPVPIGERLRTHHQYFSFTKPCIGWRMSTYFTCEKAINDGRANYRKPASIMAWLTVIVMLPKKYWGGLLFWWKNRKRKTV